MEEIYQAPLFKRIIASILDVIITLLLSLGFFMLLINGAVDIGFHNLNYKISQFTIQEESSLFYIRKDENNNFLEVSQLSYNVENLDEYKSFIKNIHDYYFHYVTSDNKQESEFNKKYMLFNEMTLKNSVFCVSSLDDSYLNYQLLDDVVDVSTGKVVNKSDVEKYKQAVANFFIDANKGVYNLALSEFTASEKFQQLVTQLQVIERLEALICVVVSTFIFISIPVLLNKNGETAFMHVLGICFSDSYGYKVKWRHKIIRSIMVLLLHASSAYLFGIPLVANIIVCLATPQKRSLIDFASNETAIDKKTSVILEE